MKNFILLLFMLLCLNVYSQTPQKGQFTDPRDNQTYNWVKIGNQNWMAENLNFATDTGSWVYDNDPKNAEIYGRLYNWYTANTVCPQGWHLPSEVDWNKLFEFIKKDKNISEGWYVYDLWKIDDILKSTEIWKEGEYETDEYGFSALPAGSYADYRDKVFGWLGTSTSFWFSTSGDYYDRDNSRMAKCFTCIVESLGPANSCSKETGLSVRCIKD